MLFKGNILKFFKSQEELPLSAVIYCQDDFYIKLIKNFIKNRNSDLVSRWGVNTTTDWFESTFLTLSLFGQEESFFIYETQNIPENLIESALKGPSKVFLHFKKKPKFFKKLSPCIEIVEFNFWEMDQLLELLCLELEVQLSQSLKEYFLTWGIESKVELYSTIQQLSLRFDLQSLSLDDVKDELESLSFNVFNLSGHVSNKNMRFVWKKILTQVEEGAWGTVHSALLFLRSLFIKSLDESYKEKKSRLSQYDKEVLKIQRSYSVREISTLVKEISNWEILTKRKSEDLKNLLRLKLIPKT